MKRRKKYKRRKKKFYLTLKPIVSYLRRIQKKGEKKRLTWYKIKSFYLLKKQNLFSGEVYWSMLQILLVDTCMVYGLDYVLVDLEPLWHGSCRDFSQTFVLERVSHRETGQEPKLFCACAWEASKGASHGFLLGSRFLNIRGYVLPNVF